MEDDFTIFVKEFNNEVRFRADSNNYEIEEAFTECMCDALVEFGEIEDYLPCSWIDKSIGARVDAYHFDDDHETVTLVVSAWKGWDGEEKSKGRLTNSEIDASVKRITKYLSSSLKGKLPGSRIDDGHPASDLALTIRDLKGDLKMARVVLISDGEAPPREGTVSQVEGIEVSVSIWDIRRLYSRQISGEREGITIDFNDYGNPISFVEYQSPNGFYTTYLAFVSGEVLADLYEYHKTRLLEMNVRVFLSQRVKVNQGIRDTIRNEPGMFGAYNNGITVYAEDLTTEELEDGTIGISKVKDFQIVNGGQTTASLYHTRKTYKSPLDDIFVQMKIMVIHESAKPEYMAKIRLSDDLVPKIGRYSNTQNKIQMSDLSANDPPHPELSSISLQLPAPDSTGGTRISYWFYEKSRGMWAEKRRLEAKTVAQRRQFDLKFPRSQRFNKGDFAKAWYSFHQKPHIVSLGPQKCFAQFNSNLLKDELAIASQTPGYWPEYFRRTVGLLVIWRALHSKVRRRVKEGIYQSYAQDILAYTISLLSSQMDRKLDLEKFWDSQEVPEPVLEYILQLADIAHEHIIDLPKGRTHVKEWCKKEDCWKELEKKKIPRGVPAELAKFSTKKERGARPSKSQGEIAVEWCVSKGHQSWMDLSKWMKERSIFAGKQRSQAFNMGRTLKNNKTPSDRLSIPCKKIWEDAEMQYGWKG